MLFVTLQLVCSQRCVYINMGSKLRVYKDNMKFGNGRIKGKNELHIGKIATPTWFVKHKVCVFDIFHFVVDKVTSRLINKNVLRVIFRRFV